MKLTKLLFILFCLYAVSATAQTGKSNIEIYGFVMTDMGYNVNTVNPDWYDALRASRLPSYDKEFAPNGKVFFSARQSKFGVKSSMPTSLGEFKTKFEFDMYGVGGDAGQTTIRLRHAYGQIGHFGAGQTNSAFMDVDVFPNSLEYWGPTGMLFFRNIQIRYMPLMDKTNDLTFALENPGASGDGGIYSNRIELSTVRAHFQLPDLTAHYRYSGDWGYVQFGGIVGSLKWEDINDTATYKLGGSATRWGAVLSTNINLGKKAVLRLMGNYGEGMENYMNDAPVDVALKNQPGNITEPVKGVALPITGIVAFLDINWSKEFSSSIGYSANKVTNSDAQGPTAYKMGQYALVNVLYYPVENVTTGIEFLYARRDNYNGFFSDNPQVRFAFKYNFSKVFTF